MTRTKGSKNKPKESIPLGLGQALHQQEKNFVTNDNSEVLDVVHGRDDEETDESGVDTEEEVNEDEE